MHYNSLMATAVLVPLSEYLGQTYHPDRDYVEGILQERNVGELSHSDAQGRTYLFILTQLLGFWAGVEVRVQVKPNRFRIPDVTVVHGSMPSGRIIASPPELVVEILSPEDRVSDIQERIDDYLSFGIPCVWVINPETRRAWTHTLDGSHEAKDGILQNPAGDIAMPLSAIFPHPAA